MSKLNERLHPVMDSYGYLMYTWQGPVHLLLETNFKTITISPSCYYFQLKKHHVHYVFPKYHEISQWQ